MIEVVRGDITKLEIDAIVNAANERLEPGGGVDGAIHRAAGPELHAELRRRYTGCPTGDAVVTRGYCLPARYVIHAVGPIWGQSGVRVGPESDPAPLRPHSGPTPRESRRSHQHGLLTRAYESAFARAMELGDVRSIAFPAISTGVYGFPKRPAAEIAIAVMRTHEQRFERIIASLLDDENAQIYRELLGY
jgi:O-acetyl-ADP-ribose deacetylase